MSVLQAIAGFIYQVQVVSNYAYLPEMAREVGQARMTSYTAIFTQTQFSSVSGRRRSFLEVCSMIISNASFYFPPVASDFYNRCDWC